MIKDKDDNQLIKETAQRKVKKQNKKDFFKKYKKSLIIIVFVVLAVGGFIIAGLKGVKPENKEQIQTEILVRKDLIKSVTLNGTIKSLKSYNIVSEVVDTEVEEVYVKVGDMVKAGDLIVSLDSSGVQRAYNIAQKKIDNTKSKNQIDIAEADRSLQNAQTLLSLRNAQTESDIKKAEDRIREYEVEILNAQSEISELVTKESELQGEIDKLQNVYNTEKRVLQNKQRQITKIENRKNPDEEEDINGSQSLGKIRLDATDIQNAQESRQTSIEDKKTKLAEIKSKREGLESKLKNAKESIRSHQNEAQKLQINLQESNISGQKNISDTKSSANMARLNAELNIYTAEDELKKAQRQLDSTKLFAQIDGIVTHVNVKKGDIYKGGEIAVIQDIGGFKVTAEADQFDISDIEKGMRAEIFTRTTGDIAMKGEVDFVSPVMSTVESSSGKDNNSSTGGSYPVEVKILDPSERLRIGMNAKVVIVENEVKSALVIPESCIIQDEAGKTYVNVQMDDGTIKRSDVEIGLKTDYYVELISKDLKEGALIIVPVSITDESIAKT